MCAEGVVLRDRDGLAGRIRAEAGSLLALGPPPLAPEEIETFRYGISDLLDDFVGNAVPDEGLFIAHQLAIRATDFVLARNHRWTGDGKWMTRALKHFDPALCQRLTAALTDYYRRGEKDDLVAFADDALAPAGGRLFAGYRSVGKRHKRELPSEHNATSRADGKGCF